MNLSIFSDLLGTTKAFFRIGRLGPRLKDVAGSLAVRNAVDSAEVSVTAARLDSTSDVGLVINSDATGVGADRSITLQRPTAGMTANVVLTLPADDGTPGDVLRTDGTGVLSWVAPVDQGVRTDTTSFTFGSGAVVPAFTLPANAIVQRVRVVIDTSFNGAPQLSVGINGGSASKYMAATENWLDEDMGLVFEANPGYPANPLTEAIELYYTAGGATAGAGRVLVDFVNPS